MAAAALGTGICHQPPGKTLLCTCWQPRPRYCPRPRWSRRGPAAPEKHGLFDDVALVTPPPRPLEFHLAGPTAETILRRSGCEMPPAGDLAHHETWIGAVPVRLVRESPTGREGWTLIGKREHSETVATILRERGASEGFGEISPAAFDALRIEAGTPVFGRDVTPENLPQEVGRDSRAINFVKGCYLGQETVARIDALGHVNKLLRGKSSAKARLPRRARCWRRPTGRRSARSPRRVSRRAGASPSPWASSARRMEPRRLSCASCFLMARQARSWPTYRCYPPGTADSLVVRRRSSTFDSVALHILETFVWNAGDLEDHLRPASETRILQDDDPVGRA